MKKRKDVVTKFIHRTQDYGLLFRHRYEVKPGYGETADIITVVDWLKVKNLKPARGAGIGKRQRARQ